MKVLRNIARASATGLLMAGAVGIVLPTAAHADETVTFEVANGSLALAQTPSGSGTPLVEGTAVAMPVTTITDGRSEVGRSALWSVSAAVTDLTTVPGAIIAANQLTLDETVGSFTSGTGTRVDEAPVVATGTLVSATGDSINSVFTYTPTVLLATQSNPNSGSYTGTVTQTVT